MDCRFLVLALLLAVDIGMGHGVPIGMSAPATDVDIAPGAAQVKEGATQILTATVMNDPKHLGVRFSVVSLVCDFGRDAAPPEAGRPDLWEMHLSHKQILAAL
jgi:hypothetical protein